MENRERLIVYGKEWKKNNPELAKKRERNHRLKKKYGITLADFNRMVKEQDNKCAVCSEDLSNGKQIDVDHCHKTRKVRGITHNHCNCIVECCNENVDVLENAIKYLEKHNENNIGNADLK